MLILGAYNNSDSSHFLGLAGASHETEHDGSKGTTETRTIVFMRLEKRAMCGLKRSNEKVRSIIFALSSLVRRMVNFRAFPIDHHICIVMILVPIAHDITLSALQIPLINQPRSLSPSIPSTLFHAVKGGTQTLRVWRLCRPRSLQVETSSQNIPNSIEVRPFAWSYSGSALREVMWVSEGDERDEEGERRTTANEMGISLR